MAHVAGSTAAHPWYRGLDRKQWNTLFASNLGWMFDGYETYALILTVGVALHQLLQPAQFAQIPAYAGGVIGLTLLGWGIGGMIGGILADYIGRKRTMMISILAYSLTTGLSAFAWNWESFAVLRLVVGIAIGSEWATGTSIVAELWPDKARGKAAGLMQCGLGIGFFVASLVWLFVGGHGPNAWRYMYFIGILPALFTLWMRAGIPESQKWQHANEQRLAARRSGHRMRFTLVELFSLPEVRRRTVFAFLLSLTTTLTWWGISAWLPPYVASVAAKAGLSGPQWASYAGMAYNIGAIAGYISLGFFADRWGRKPVALGFVALAWLTTPVVFLWTHDLNLLLVASLVNGFFSLGLYSWMPVWLPELFPTRIRATGVAFVFNSPRFIAWIGPLVAGWLVANMGGFSNAAMSMAMIYLLGLFSAPFLPETRGKPLPEDV
ncbi:MAG TPA: MFS transporter [Burkholderiales bacterium]|jgi:MFS family permease|nr:MFS transporter [Burkholderiales bacterium]